MKYKLVLQKRKYQELKSTRAVTQRREGGDCYE